MLSKHKAFAETMIFPLDECGSQSTELIMNSDESEHELLGDALDEPANVIPKLDASLATSQLVAAKLLVHTLARCHAVL